MTHRAPRAFAIAAAGLLPACANIAGLTDLPVLQSSDAASDGATIAPLPEAGPTGCSAALVDVAKLKPVIQACMLLRGCPVPNEPVSVSLSSCITYNWPMNYAALSCVTAANADCDSTEKCFGAGYAVSECATGENSAKCVGTKAVYCNASDSTKSTYQDCAVMSGTCSPFTYGDAGASGVGCAVVSGCTESSASWQCQGTQYLYKCYGGVGIGRSCGAHSESCETIGTSTTCYFQGDTCFVPTATCDTATNTATVCANGFTDTFQCLQGLTCAADAPNHQAYCLAPGCPMHTPCTPSCDPDGHTIHLCIGAAPLALDCRNYKQFNSLNSGFSRCFDLGSLSGGRPDPVCN